MPPLYVLPGIGADGRLFDEQRAVRDIRMIDWITPAHRRETLHDYATRLASALDIDGPFDLGGASFGGMVALELARHLAPQRVFLFGSCRTPRGVAPSLRAFHVLARLMPKPPRIAARWFGARSREHIDLFADMLRSTPLDFVHWATTAIFSWRGVETLPMPVIHIHGDRDRVIPISRVQPDHIIPGAGHLLNITHAEAVNECLRKPAAPE